MGMSIIYMFMVMSVICVLMGMSVKIYFDVGLQNLFVDGDVCNMLVQVTKGWHSSPTIAETHGDPIGLKHYVTNNFIHLIRFVANP